MEYMRSILFAGFGRTEQSIRTFEALEAKLGTERSKGWKVEHAKNPDEYRTSLNANPGVVIFMYDPRGWMGADVETYAVKIDECREQGIPTAFMHHEEDAGALHTLRKMTTVTTPLLIKEGQIDSGPNQGLFERTAAEIRKGMLTETYIGIVGAGRVARATAYQITRSAASGALWTDAGRKRKPSQLHILINNGSNQDAARNLASGINDFAVNGDAITTVRATTATLGEIAANARIRLVTAGHFQEEFEMIQRAYKVMGAAPSRGGGLGLNLAGAYDIADRLIDGRGNTVIFTNPVNAMTAVYLGAGIAKVKGNEGAINRVLASVEGNGMLDDLRMRAIVREWVQSLLGRQIDVNAIEARALGIHGSIIIPRVQVDGVDLERIVEQAADNKLTEGEEDDEDVEFVLDTHTLGALQKQVSARGTGRNVIGDDQGNVPEAAAEVLYRQVVSLLRRESSAPIPLIKAVHLEDHADIPPVVGNTTLREAFPYGAPTMWYHTRQRGKAIPEEVIFNSSGIGARESLVNSLLGYRQMIIAEARNLSQQQGIDVSSLLSFFNEE